MGFVMRREVSEKYNNNNNNTCGQKNHVSSKWALWVLTAIQ